MYALCFYNLSPSPSRDQTMTGQAIMAINEFISRYPNSDQIENFRKINDELTERLHEKSYINAYTYYKIGRYKSAIVALKNALKQYPESKHREQIMYLIVDSSYRLASNSVADKQTDRYLAMLDSYLSFKEEYPESKHIRGAGAHGAARPRLPGPQQQGQQRIERWKSRRTSPTTPSRASWWIWTRRPATSTKA